MTPKQPTPKQIEKLVGGPPLDYAFYPNSGLLVVIAPSGQKVRFKPEDWQSPVEENPQPKTSGSHRDTPELAEKPAPAPAKRAKGRPRKDSTSK